MEARLSALGIREIADRINGIDVTGDGGIDKAKNDGFIPKEYNLDKAWQVGRELMKDSPPWFGEALLKDWIGIGSIGCAAAHIHAQAEAGRRAAKEGVPL